MSPTRRPTVVLRQRPWIFCHNCLPAPWGAWCACPVEIDWCFKASNILQFPSLSWRFMGIYTGVFSCPFPLGNLVWWCASVLLWNEWLKPEMTIWHVSKLPVNLAHRLGVGSVYPVYPLGISNRSIPTMRWSMYSLSFHRLQVEFETGEHPRTCNLHNYSKWCLTGLTSEFGSNLFSDKAN
jgi:hypothetical protein